MVQNESSLLDHSQRIQRQPRAHSRPRRLLCPHSLSDPENTLVAWHTPLREATYLPIREKLGWGKYYRGGWRGKTRASIDEEFETFGRSLPVPTL